MSRCRLALRRAFFSHSSWVIKKRKENATSAVHILAPKIDCIERKEKRGLTVTRCAYHLTCSRAKFGVFFFYFLFVVVV